MSRNKSVSLAPWSWHGARTQAGVTSIEYALLASLIAMAILVGLGATGESNGMSWERWAQMVLRALHL